jgi:hypothetical protein
VSALLLLALRPIGAVVGADTGPSAVPPAEEVVAAETRVRSTLDATAFQARMQDQVLTAMARIPTRPAAAVLSGQGPTHVGESPPYSRLAAEGVDTVLEVAVVQVGLVGPLGLNPDLSVAMSIRVRVFRTTAPAPIYEATMISNPMELVPLQPGDPVPRRGRKLREWAEGEGAPLREELTRTMKMVAEKVVDEVFLLYRPLGKAR